MTEIEITKVAFTILRTPADLARYAREAYDHIDQNRELKRTARLRKGPYKTFLEELMPFSRFCTWKYGVRDDVLCALVQGTPGCDAIVIDRKTGSEHSVEITYPINGQQLLEEGRQLNERGITDIKTWLRNDISRQQSAIDLTLKIANKKMLRDYRSPGGSSLIFVFDHMLFWDSNPKHVELLASMRRQLSLLDFQADNVLLMFVGDQKKILEVKRTVVLQESGE
jgi:hypothetical protein